MRARCWGNILLTHALGLTNFVRGFGGTSKGRAYVRRGLVSGIKNIFETRYSRVQYVFHLLVLLTEGFVYGGSGCWGVIIGNNTLFTGT